MRMIARFIGAFCVATVLAEIMILALLFISGRLNEDSTAKIIALACGIDVSAERVRQALTTAEAQEVPSFEEIVQARANASLELDLRNASLSSHSELLKFYEERLSKNEAGFDRRLEDYRQALTDREAGVQTQAVKDTQQTFEALKPAQAKEQLIKMLEDNQIADVVTIIQGLPSDKRKKILAEFKDPSDAEKLQVIIRRIMEGEPDKTLIDKAKKDAESVSPIGASP